MTRKITRADERDLRPSEADHPCHEWKAETVVGGDLTPDVEGLIHRMVDACAATSG